MIDGIIEDNSNEYFSIYANLVAPGERITFKLYNAKSIEIFDLAGRKLLSVDVQHQLTIKLSTKNFSSGLYVYQIHFNNQATKSGEFVVE